ncbi:MAG: M23 family metallopeptidase [Candidatus Dadabacteria bacterium]|nr:MAG: M23 family metallopeptidase [Candidatus Dadabacteria bacterium]
MKKALIKLIFLLIISTVLPSCFFFSSNYKDQLRSVSFWRAKVVVKPEGELKRVVSRFKKNLLWPLKSYVITSAFKRRGRRFHTGIDIDGYLGQDVYSAVNGEVWYTGYKRGYGRVVVIKHRNLYLLYAHLLRVKVWSGEQVRKGEVIAEVGKSGNATGSHLHFETRVKINKNYFILNPVLFYR